MLADRYRLLHRIGGGGMGAVFEAEDVALRRPVAVKVLPGLDTGDRAFLREARALSRLRHPGIVRLFDAGADQGDAYLVLELVRGRTLRDTIAEGPVGDAEAGRIGRELAEALAHAHSLGVVHRDVSPGNVLIDRTGRVRLADFGIARMSESTATVGGEVWGTPAYMAPEQVAGDPVGPPADIYALGLVLLESLTARRAFPGPPTEAGFARLHRDPPVPDALPGGWTPLLRAMTARAPADRPYAASVAARLGSPPVPAARRPVTQRMPGPPPAVKPPWWRRPAAALTGLCLVAALLVGMAVRAQQAGVPGALATTSPAAVASTAPAAPPPPPPDDDEDDDENEDDDDDGKGKGDNGKGKGKNKD